MIDSSKIYPWQTQVWQQLLRSEQRLPHALLLYGRAGIGKNDFARNLSKALLCQHKNAQGNACETCSSCHWFNENNHPDFRLLSPEQEAESEELVTTKKTKKKLQISVAQVRELTDFLNLSSHSHGLRIVLVYPAESLNASSANALLKMLEEPTAGVVFILVSHCLSRLLPTILSRCQKINMPTPDTEQALQWLQAQGISNAEQALAYLGSAPMDVLNESSQLSQWAEIWQLLGSGQKLEPHLVAPVLVAQSAEAGMIALQKWLYDMLSLRLTHHVRYHTQSVSVLKGLLEKVDINRLLELQKKLTELRNFATHPLNHELQMENLLLEYTRIFQTQ